MILVIIGMKVLAEKRMEDETGLSFLEEWDTREYLKSHLGSERFRVLRGAMNLLQEPYEMVFHTVEAIKKNTKPGSEPAISGQDDWGQRSISQTRIQQEGYHEIKHERSSGRRVSSGER